MGTKLSPRGDYAAASRHHISIPQFFNFRTEDGRFVADFSWKTVPLSAEDYEVHLKRNVSDRLRIIQNSTEERSVFPYEFEHLSDTRPRDTLTVSENFLNCWYHKVENLGLNTANALLFESLGDAQDEILFRKANAIETAKLARASQEFDPAI